MQGPVLCIFSIYTKKSKKIVLFIYLLENIFRKGMQLSLRQFKALFSTPKLTILFQSPTVWGPLTRKRFFKRLKTHKIIETRRILIDTSLKNNILPQSVRGLSSIVEITLSSLDKCFSTIKGGSELCLIISAKSNRDLTVYSPKQNSSCHRNFIRKIVLLRIRDYM